MLTPRIWLPLAIPLVFVGCRDAAGPSLDERNVVGADLCVTSELVDQPSSAAELHLLQQAPTAPALETYQVSFWAYKGEASMVTVNYQPVGAQSVGQPFLRFYIPKNALLAGAEGESLRGGDSVLVTLTIDPVNFSVDFQPSGVAFSVGTPANLALWYQNANPDLNGDGIVDATDQLLLQQVAFWYRSSKANSWFKLSSDNNTTLPSVSTAVYHFSEFAVSW